MSERRAIVPVTRSLLPRVMQLVERVLAGSPYLDGALDALRSATSAPGADGRALASVIGEQVEGVVVFGFFGGAAGAGRLQIALVAKTSRRGRVGVALVEHAIALLESEGARFVLAELPEDSRALPGARAFLESLGFAQESVVENFYRDGVALSFMRRDLGD